MKSFRLSFGARSFSLFTGWILMITLSGCGPAPDPLDLRISAANDRLYRQWFSRNRAKLDRKHENRLIEAIQTIKLEESIYRPGRSSTSRAASLNALLDNSTVRQVIVFGEFLKIHRLALENYIDAEMLDLNRDQRAEVRPGSDLSISLSIDRQIREVAQRMKDRKRRLDQIQVKMQEIAPDIPLELWSSRPRNRNDLPWELLLSRFKTPRYISAGKN